jgi:hypothetical protein
MTDLGGFARLAALDPGRDVLEVLLVHAGPAADVDPGHGLDVGQRVVGTDEPVAALQASLEDAVQATSLVLVAVDAVLNFLRGVLEEKGKSAAGRPPQARTTDSKKMIGLSLHGSARS